MSINNPSITIINLIGDGITYSESKSEDSSLKNPNIQSFKCTVCSDVFPALLNLQRHYVKHIVNKPYKCAKCEKSYFTQSSLDKHDSLHNGIKLFTCDICKKSFEEKYLLKIHRVEHKFGDLACNACFQSFPTTLLLHQHEKSHTVLKDGSLCYPCSICKYEFVYKRDLEEHLSTHDKIINHSCDKCQESFFFSYILKKHSGIHSTDHECNICYEKFPSKPLLNNHEKTHLRMRLDSESELCYVCDLCDVTYPFKAELETHYNNDHDSQQRFSCKICDETFIFSYLYKKHLIGHTEGKHHNCEICHKKFKNIKHLSQHMKLHENIKYDCPLCEKSFRSKWLMNKHSIVHSSQKPFGCEFCGSTFSLRNNLQRHYLVHMQKREFSCGDCSATFKTKIAFKEHTKLHSEKSAESSKCDECGQVLVSSLALVKHIKKVHTEITIPKDYTCKVCKKVLKHQPSFHKHMLLHSGKRPYKCEYCNKRFIQKFHLVSHHSYNHPGLAITMPYKCQYCGEGYLLKSRLLIHLSKCHPSPILKHETSIEEDVDDVS